MERQWEVQNDEQEAGSVHVLSEDELRSLGVNVVDFAVPRSSENEKGESV